jgi:hypothetical protein
MGAVDSNDMITCAPSTTHSGDYVMFCERDIANDDEHLQLLLNMTCGRDDNEVPEHLAGKPGYAALICNRGTRQLQLFVVNKMRAK